MFEENRPHGRRTTNGVERRYEGVVVTITGSLSNSGKSLKPTSGFCVPRRCRTKGIKVRDITMVVYLIESGITPEVPTTGLMYTCKTKV